MSGGSDKQLLEAFRVRQHAGPHPAVAAAAAAAAHPAAQHPQAAEAIQPDEERVVLHFDADSFYAQVEEVREPSLAGRPLAVTQKYLVVTCNYPARARGVTKLMGVAEAKKRCPHIVLVRWAGAGCCPLGRLGTGAGADAYCWLPWELAVLPGRRPAFRPSGCHVPFRPGPCHSRAAART